MSRSDTETQPEVAGAAADESVPGGRVMLVGLGPTGVGIGRALVERRECRLVAAVDIEPTRSGRDLGELLGGDDLGVVVEADVASVSVEADVAVIATSSFLDQLEPIVVALVERGVNVVSVGEELSYPQAGFPAIADRIDRLARRHGVSVLGTGANPGFLMDTLPLFLSGLTERVERVEIRRTADLSEHPGAFDRFGLGKTIDEFDEAQADGQVAGHIGFEQAAAALAHGLGWELDDVIVDPVRPAFVAPYRRTAQHVVVPSGAIAAVVHTARGYVGEKRVVDLTIHFGIFAPGDPVEAGDRWRIHGEEQLIELTAEGGLDHATSTIAMASNIALAVVDAEPGLRTMGEFGAYAFAAKGGFARDRAAEPQADRGTTPAG